MSTQAAMAPRCLGAMAPWSLGALVRWCHGAKAPRCLGALVPWCHGATVPSCLGATNLCRTPNRGNPPVAMPLFFAKGHLISYAKGFGMESTQLLANLGEVSSQHLVGFFEDECTNLLWRRAAGWFDWMGRDEPERQRSESQWIVAARPLCHLKYPVGYLSCLQRILPAALWKLYFKAAAATLPPQRLSQRHVPLGAEASTAVPPTADGFGTGTPVPSPQSQSFSRSYGSILPTSLAYIVPSTRGCSPWRPDAVMSTTGRGRHSVLRIFKGRWERTGHHATCGALPAAGPYLRLSRFQGGQAVKQKR
ncbi:hypothetical protein CQW23_35093 [Capsicum baccatum]|uniref:Uncharacterized protein n=1 Tax=Capsicum baccatum TaxID=33114 RepID=A0A2G2UX45_CAPBA|nr:hypothetical protein CQW23_35093 [Capsicum baccatum]